MSAKGDASFAEEVPWVDIYERQEIARRQQAKENTEAWRAARKHSRVSHGVHTESASRQSRDFRRRPGLEDNDQEVWQTSRRSSDYSASLALRMREQQEPSLSSQLRADATSFRRRLGIEGTGTDQTSCQSPRREQDVLPRSSQLQADTTPRTYPGAVDVPGIAGAAAAGDLPDDITAGGPRTVVAWMVDDNESNGRHNDVAPTSVVLSLEQARELLAQRKVGDSGDRACCNKTGSRYVLLLLLLIVIIGVTVGSLLASGTIGQEVAASSSPTEPPTESPPTESPPTESPPTDSQPTGSTPTDATPTGSQPVVRLDSMQRLDGQKIGDRFGDIVAISGNGETMAVGAETGGYDGAEQGKSGPGYVTVFGRVGKKWQQRGETLKGDANGDQFGRCVALNRDGTVLAIGAWNNYGVGYEAGHARVFLFDGTAWLQMGEDLQAEQAKDSFGWYVSLSDDGKTVAVSARQGDPSVDKLDAGYVKVFTNNGNLRGGSSSGWSPLGLVLEGEAAGDLFGKALSLSADGRRLAVGAAHGAGGKGRVQVFDFDGAGWNQVGQALDGANDKDWQGEVSMSADGSVLAIGASGTDTNGSNSGLVRAYELVGSTWTQKGQDLLGEKSLDMFGANHISLSGNSDCLAVGANHFDNRGKGYLFRWEDLQWQEVANVTGAGIGDRFGYSPAISDDCSWLAFGASQYDGQNNVGPGYVEVYEVTEV